MPTETHVSAGGVTYRRIDGRIEVVLVAVGPQKRWQLPKGLVEPNEEPESAARREVREEGGVDATIVQPIETIEYWYVAAYDPSGQRVRYHKFVHFFLLAYTSGDVADHDREVEDARWFDGRDAIAHLAFANEKRVVERAIEMIGAADA
jgi:8-oxo-dGTP pyrophosphatase MutT (NUDIX family)